MNLRLLLLLLGLLCAGNCYAYIDPNAGGWLYQFAFPLFVAIGGAWSLVRRKLLRLFRIAFAKKDAESD